MKKAGILLPITSLPSKYGIGCFSKSAYEFVDFLSLSGQSYWQILPLGQTGYGDSPYQSPSSFAGNPYMISLDTLIEKELLSREECDFCDFGAGENYVDYEKQYNNRYPLLRKAYSRFVPDEAFENFKRESSYWLLDYALFMAVKGRYGGKEWLSWDEDIKRREPSALLKYQNELQDEINFWCFLQFEFSSQWKALKKYANEKGISIIGDLPIYASMDSADVWANPHLFQLEEDRTPIAVAGCPPDAFSPLGQLWGNPLYDWENHKKENYFWWIKRLDHSFKLFDCLRIDHFRGFESYYSIPYGNPDATIGQWEKGPGMDLFLAMEKALGEKNVIAEDLGFITPEVKQLLKDSGFAGIKVIEFAFDSRDTGFKNDYLPHNYPSNCVAYTGTHDNETLLSWLKKLSDEDFKAVCEYLCVDNAPREILVDPLIALIMRSQAKLCIVPLSDYLKLGDEARINTPATTGNNWQWRVKKSLLTFPLAKKIYDTSARFGRI